uniref:Queuosine 5'-phosphate N-glycosylase/hydrolase n=1 Tax=Elaeophora elaphi TaxID=1147741 RepID=A0A0R3S012_9BILA
MSFFGDRLYPRESAEFIVTHGTNNIELSQEGVLKVAQLIMDAINSNEFTEDTYFSLDLHPQIADRRAIDWIFLIDTINFSFWSDHEVNFKVTFHGKQYTGYLAACACINRALEENIPITNAIYMENITADDVRRIFKTDDGSEIPLLEERVKVINEAGRVLNQEFGGTFYNCILKCNKSAIKLMKDVVENFESYRDFATYKGQKISFLKRAQILVSDIHLCMRKVDDTCNFHDIHELTMFADYRVPQALHFLGVLKYSSALMKQLEEKELLQNGSEHEVELRGFSIKACDKIVETIRQKTMDGSNTMYSAAYVDNFLWLYRRKNAKRIEVTVPFHRTRCIYY